MSERLEVGDFLLIAEAVLGVPALQILSTLRRSALEDALAAPFASLEGIALYGDPVERAAICCSRVIRSRPLPDPIKRLGYECMREMLDREEAPWPRPSQDANEIELAVDRLAASTISERDFVAWVKGRVEIGRREP